MKLADGIHTAGPWRQGKAGAAIVADVPTPHFATGHGTVEPQDDFYGGYLVAESVAGCNRPLIAAAPRLLRALQVMVAWHATRGDIDGNDTINPPEYQTPEIREAMAAIAQATTPLPSLKATP